MATHVLAEAHGDERGALLAFLEAQRGGHPAGGAGADRRAGRDQRPSASELSLAGLVKHVAETEQGWVARAGQEPPRVTADRGRTGT